MPDGRFTVPTFVYLDPERREKLERLVTGGEVDLPELLSELLARHLDGLPAPAPEPAPPADGGGVAEQIRQRRAELRLAARAALSDSPPPAWIQQYLDDLRAEIARLERQLP